MAGPMASSALDSSINCSMAPTPRRRALLAAMRDQHASLPDRSYARLHRLVMLESDEEEEEEDDDDDLDCDMHDAEMLPPQRKDARPRANSVDSALSAAANAAADAHADNPSLEMSPTAVAAAAAGVSRTNANSPLSASASLRRRFLRASVTSDGSDASDISSVNLRRRSGSVSAAAGLPRLQELNPSSSTLTAASRKRKAAEISSFELDELCGMIESRVHTHGDDDDDDEEASNDVDIDYSCLVRIQHSTFVTPSVSLSAEDLLQLLLDLCLALSASAATMTSAAAAGPVGRITTPPPDIAMQHEDVSHILLRFDTPQLAQNFVSFLHFSPTSTSRTLHLPPLTLTALSSFFPLIQSVHFVQPTKRFRHT